MNWHKYLKIAYVLAEDSPDPSTQNGAILINYDGNILSQGINELPEGVEATEERLNNRSLKYSFIAHAEFSAVTAAAKSGVCTNGLIMVCPWGSCTICARVMIRSGIKMLVRHKAAMLKSPERWLEEITLADQMFKEAGVEIKEIITEINGVELMHCGEIWRP